MKHLSISPGAKFVFGIVGILLPVQTHAQYRVVVEPSVDIVGIHDDNLFFSDAERPASDFIQRVRPAVDLRLESARWSAAASYAADSDRYSQHTALNNTRARQRATIGVQYATSPRLTLALDGSYMDTDTLTDLNMQTGLGASRANASQLSFQPTVRLRISPRLIARVASSATSTRVSEGAGTRGHIETIGIDRSVTARDLFTVDYEQSFHTFDAEPETVRSASYVVRAGWTRDLDPRTQLVLQAGPRVAGGEITPDVTVSVTHQMRLSSMTISAQQTETIAIGHVGTLQTRSLSAMFRSSPTRSVTAYVGPGVHRSSQSALEATVYRLGVGVRYSVTSNMAIDVAYNRDRQRGALGRLRGDGELSRSTLVVAVTSRWNGLERTGLARSR